MSQRDETWVKARHGKITASQFSAVLAGPDTKKKRNYYDQLVDQRLGVEDFTDYVEKPWFEHGRGDRKSVG